MFKRIKHVHFVGIGGIGMSGIAEVLLNLGYRVTGSDIRSTPITESPGAAVARPIFLTHAAENVEGRPRRGDVIRRASGQSGNPGSQRRKIPVIPRAEMLAELARLEIQHRRCRHARKNHDDVDDRDDSGSCGLRSHGRGRRSAEHDRQQCAAGQRRLHRARSRRKRPIVSAAVSDDRRRDEYRSRPSRSLHAISRTSRSAFLSFINKVPFYGAAVLCLDDPAVQSLIPQIKRRIVTYGTAARPTSPLWMCGSRVSGPTFTLRFNGGSIAED